jgi:hypothetical protein
MKAIQPLPGMRLLWGTLERSTRILKTNSFCEIWLLGEVLQKFQNMLPEVLHNAGGCSHFIYFLHLDLLWHAWSSVNAACSTVFWSSCFLRSADAYAAVIMCS